MNRTDQNPGVICNHIRRGTEDYRRLIAEFVAHVEGHSARERDSQTVESRQNFFGGRR